MTKFNFMKKFIAVGSLVVVLTGLTTTIQASNPSVAGPVLQYVTLPNKLPLIYSAADDGLPSGNLFAEWTQVSGPGTTTFDSLTITPTQTNQYQITANALFSQGGVFVIRLSVWDAIGATPTILNVNVNVTAAGEGILITGPSTPTVYMPNSLPLTFSITDLGLASPTLFADLTLINGPGPVNIEKAPLRVVSNNPVTYLFSSTST